MIIPHVHHKTKLFNLAFALIIIPLLSLPVGAQASEEGHKQLRSALESGNVDAALMELNALRGSNSGLFHANNYDYLLARLLEKKGDAVGASSSYQSAVDRNSLLSQYALWRLAQISRSTGDLVLERERLRQLLSLTPTTLLREAAAMRLGQSFFESKDYSAAVTALRSLNESKNRQVAREALALVGQSLVKAGRLQEAREVFNRLVMQMPDAARPDDFALAGVRGLDALDSTNTAAGVESTEKGVSQLAESEHLLRASVYQFNRDFEAARLHYLAVIERYPQSPTVANALYQTGRGFYLQLRYDEALRYFQRVLDQFPDSTNARDALSFTAGTYNRLKRTDHAVAAYKLFIERFPDAPNPERSYLNVIDALHEAGRHREAMDWVSQTRTRFNGQLGGALALFAQTRIHLAQGSWPEVLADTNALRKLSDLGGTRVPSGTLPAEVTFLRAYALEQLGRIEEAITEYLSSPNGRNDYYGQRATQRMLALSANAKTRPLIHARANGLRVAAEKAINAGQAEEGRRLAQSALRLTQDAALRDETLELVRRAYEALPAYKLPEFKLVPLGRQGLLSADAAPREPTHRVIADELIFLGLYDEGVPEFAASRLKTASAPAEPVDQKSSTRSVQEGVKEPAKGTPATSDIDYTVAIYSLRGGLANRAVRFGEQLWKPVPGDYVFELAPREMVDLLYPLPYRESLLKHAPIRGVDPRLIISIARQESRFQPDAKSVAAARGLMQFISSTANEMAVELGLKDFRQDDLYNTDTAIRFGSQYLATLYRQFPGQTQAVAASYNGGPENVARWLARSRSSDADRYVAELGFSQTKDYVFKVMTNFWEYERLYDEKLERK